MFTVENGVNNTYRLFTEKYKIIRLQNPLRATISESALSVEVCVFIFVSFWSF